MRVQDVPLASLADLQQQGALKIVTQPDTAWEQITFGISSLDDQRPRFFASAEVRRAAALCLDRPALVNQLLAGGTEIAQAYLPESHPLYNSAAPAPAYDPAKAKSCWDRRAGWTWTITPRPRGARRGRRGYQIISLSRSITLFHRTKRTRQRQNGCRLRWQIAGSA